MNKLINFKAFRSVKITLGAGITQTISVPTSVTDEQLRKALLFTEKTSIKHGGAFTEITYQALLDCLDWFKFKRPKSLSSAVTDFLTRMERSIKKNAKFQSRLANKDFIEVYFGNLVFRQLNNIKNIRSAVYDILKQYMESPDALDASFVGAVYVLACYQCSVMDTVIKTALSLYKVNFMSVFKCYYLEEVARFADRLLKQNWNFDIVEKQKEVKASIEYVLNDIANSAFDVSADKEALKEAYLEMPKEERRKYGNLKDVIEAETGGR